jgi:hypothetical protein
MSEIPRVPRARLPLPRVAAARVEDEPIDSSLLFELLEGAVLRVVISGPEAARLLSTRSRDVVFDAKSGPAVLQQLRDARGVLDRALGAIEGEMAADGAPVAPPTIEVHSAPRRAA